MRLRCNLVFGCVSYVAELRQRMNNIYQEFRPHCQVTSDRMKERYTRAKGHYAEGFLVSLYNLHKKQGLFPKLKEAWKRLYRIVKRINDILYRIIRKIPNGKAKVVHFNRLAPFKGDNNEDKQDLRSINTREGKLSFEEFKEVYGGTGKPNMELHPSSKVAVPSIVTTLLFTEFLNSCKGITRVFDGKFGPVRCLDLISQQPSLVKVLKLSDGRRFLLYLVTRNHMDQPPSLASFTTYYGF